MAIEDNLDELYALFIANHILCMRMWGYLSSIASQAEGIQQETWIERQRKMSLESVDMWKLESHRDPEALRRRVKQQLDIAWKGITMGAPSDSQLQ